MRKLKMEDYDIFQTPKRMITKKAKRILANMMLYVSIYGSVFLIGDYKLMNNSITENTSIECFNNEEENNNNDIFLAVLNNNKLKDQEKEILYNFSDLVNDNPIINKDKTYNILKTLDIIYITRPSNYDEKVRAIYSNKDNVIYVFEPEENDNSKIIIHEFIHSIYTNEKNLKLPKYYLEGVTELLTDEYFSSQPFVEKTTYPFEVAMIKVLCEMVGKDNVLKTYKTGNMDYVKNELNKTSPSNSTEFLNNLEKVFKSFTEENKIPKQEFEEVIKYLDSYFETKYSNDDNVLDRYLYYRNIIIFINFESPYDSYLAYIIKTGVYDKPYFSEKLLENNTGSNLIALETEEEKILVK